MPEMIIVRTLYTDEPERDEERTFILPADTQVFAALAPHIAALATAVPFDRLDWCTDLMSVHVTRVDLPRDHQLTSSYRRLINQPEQDDDEPPF